MNFAVGKTEAVISIRGPGARQVRQQIFVHQECKISVATEDGQKSLRCSGSYKHLGIMYAIGHSDAIECDRRAKATSAAYAVLRKVCCSPTYSDNVKANVISTAMWSVLCHAIAVLSKLTPANFRKLHGPFLRINRARGRSQVSWL